MENFNSNQSSGSFTETLLCEEIKAKNPNRDDKKMLVLKLKDKKSTKISWEEGTVDNEHMCKKTSKSILLI